MRERERGEVYGERDGTRERTRERGTERERKRERERERERANERKINSDKAREGGLKISNTLLSLIYQQRRRKIICNKGIPQGSAISAVLCLFSDIKNNKETL